MKIIILFLVGLILVSGCTSPILNKAAENSNIPKATKIASESPHLSQLPNRTPETGLGKLCSDEQSCETFCHNNKGQCTEYCNNNTENIICQKSFIYDCKNNPSSTFCQKQQAELESKYTALKNEIDLAVEKKSLISEETYKRIISDLNELLSKGYQIEKIDKLKQEAQSNVYTTPTITPQPIESHQPKYPENFYSPDIQCTSNPDVKFSIPVVNPDDLSLVVPMGAITHDEATTHTYLFTKSGGKVTLSVPVDSILTEVSYNGRDYGLTFQASCEFVYTFGHITEPVDKIKNAFESSKTSRREGRQEDWARTSVQFKAGELIGQTSGTEQSKGFDLGAYHKNQKNYFANMARYEKSFKFMNAVCPYDYFDNQTRTAYYSKFGDFGGVVPGYNCGAASQDKVGTISGNWNINPSPEWSPINQKIAFGLDGDRNNSAIRIMMTGRGVFFIFRENPTYKRPKEVTGEHCYEEDKSDTIIYVKIISDTEMKLYVDDTAKTCPSTFPEDKAISYYR